MPGCCSSSFESAANQQFNQKKVAQELKRYREKGPGPTTRMLADGIAQSGALSGTVLDVGSGVGGLTFALLDRGATSAVAVDSPGGCGRDWSTRTVPARSCTNAMRWRRSRRRTRDRRRTSADSLVPPKSSRLR